MLSHTQTNGTEELLHFVPQNTRLRWWLSSTEVLFECFREFASSDQVGSSLPCIHSNHSYHIVHFTSLIDDGRRAIHDVSLRHPLLLPAKYTLTGVGSFESWSSADGRGPFTRRRRNLPEGLEFTKERGFCGR